MSDLTDGINYRDLGLVLLFISLSRFSYSSRIAYFLRTPLSLSFRAHLFTSGGIPQVSGVSDQEGVHLLLKDVEPFFPPAGES